MKLDKYIEDGITIACDEENVPEATNAIYKFIERYISNELPNNEIAGSLQDLYELIKEKDS